MDFETRIADWKTHDQESAETTKQGSHGSRLAFTSLSRPQNSNECSVHGARWAKSTAVQLTTLVGRLSMAGPLLMVNRVCTRARNQQRVCVEALGIKSSFWTRSSSMKEMVCAMLVVAWMAEIEFLHLHPHVDAHNTAHTLTRFAPTKSIWKLYRCNQAQRLFSIHSWICF